VLGDGEIVGPGGPLGEHPHAVDVVRDELATPDLEDLDGLPGSLQRGSLAESVARRTVSIDQEPPPTLAHV
jgi:hypothetical protein